MLEVLVAASVLAIGLLGALEVIANCSATTRGAEDRARGLMFARSKMEEILKEPVLQLGTDRGEGVDTSTDYDWAAAIEATPNSALVSVIVTARNRRSGVEVVLSALRRPDIQTPPETAGTATTTTGAAGGTL